MSNALEEYAKEHLSSSQARKSKEIGGFQMPPLLDAAYRVLFQRGGIPLSRTETTLAFVREFPYRKRWKLTFLHGWDGPGGFGKTEAAETEALFWLDLIGLEPEEHFKLYFDIDQAPHLDRGEWAHLDEWLIGEGAGKIQALNRLWNLWTTSRATGTNNSVSTPEFPDLPYIQMIGTLIAQDRIRRLNLAEVRVHVPKHGEVLLGRLVIPLHNNEGIRAKYEKISLERKQGIQDEHGRKTIKRTVGIEEGAQLLIASVKKDGLIMESKGQAIADLAVLAERENISFGYEQEGKIADRALQLQQKDLPKQDTEAAPESDTKEEAKGWQKLRADLKRLYGDVFAFYVVPQFVKASYSDVKDQLGLGITKDAVMKRVHLRKAEITKNKKPLSDLSEKWVCEILNAAVARRFLKKPVSLEFKAAWSGGGSGKPDLLITYKGQETAVAVKLTLGVDYREHEETTPENKWMPRAVAVLIVPRLLQLRVFKITG